MLEPPYFERTVVCEVKAPVNPDFLIFYAFWTLKHYVYDLKKGKKRSVFC